jgi:hypothetical protein
MRRLAPAAVLLLALAPLACGGDAAEEAAQTAADAMQQAANALQSAANDMQAKSEGGATSEPIDAQALQDRLPDELGGLERVSSERQSMGAAGMQMATAVAVYEGDGKQIELRLSSGGGIMAGPAMAFSMVDFDRTTDHGFERTVRLYGFKGMQSYDNDGGEESADLMLMIGNRVLLQMESTGMSMDDLEEALDELDPESMN